MLLTRWISPWLFMAISQLPVWCSPVRPHFDLGLFRITWQLSAGSNLAASLLHGLLRHRGCLGKSWGRYGMVMHGEGGGARTDRRRHGGAYHRIVLSGRQSLIPITCEGPLSSLVCSCGEAMRALRFRQKNFGHWCLKPPSITQRRQAWSHKVPRVL